MLFFEGTPEQQMKEIVSLMRDMSRLTDPQAVVQVYRQRVSALMRVDATLALSRRDLESPWYRITRNSRWKEDVNPWTQREKLPLLKGGLLAEVLYGDEPRVINDLKVADDDPAKDLLEGFGSMAALPLYEHGEALNMNISLRRERNTIDPATMPVLVWLGNLFGRATKSLVIAADLQRANEALDRELKTVAEIQRSLLPPVLPDIQGLRLAAHYETSQRAGGDYYDLFSLPGGKLGVLIADVSGHGTPAAVMMAITHTVAHSNSDAPSDPAAMLTHLNERLCTAYARGTTGFVTAFYGVYDPMTRALRYSSAGHNPPRLRRKGGGVEAIEGGRDVPLGILSDVRYTEAREVLRPGDGLLLYTDGITEARSRAGDEFGTQRLDAGLLTSPMDPGWTINSVLESVQTFTNAAPAEDDRTLVAAHAVE